MDQGEDRAINLRFTGRPFYARATAAQSRIRNNRGIFLFLFLWSNEILYLVWAQSFT